MPDHRLIVYTRDDGGVSVCAPSQTALRYMTHGGGRWDGFDPGFLDRQIEAQSQNGVGETAARQFVHAMQFGGCTEAEGYAIMRDRFCAHLGTGCELWTRDDIPDRWFRNAWRRSHNGGPIVIHMLAAKHLQLSRLRNYAKQKDLDLRWPLWRERVRKAETPEALKAIWPNMLKS